MRHNSKLDIRLEVPERLRIYLMSDVISQHSASLDFAFVSAKMGTDDRGPATVATAIRTGQTAGGGREGSQAGGG